MSTLFEISNDVRSLYDFAINLEPSELDEQAFKDTLEALTGELEVKSAGYVAVIHQLEMEQKKAEELAESFKAKADVRKNNIKRMKDALKWAMINANMDKVDAGDFTIKLQKNGGQQPMIITGEVPDNFKRIVYEDDKALIRKRLEEGEELSFAHLEERGMHVVIK
jgi:Siphovirus Gp157.